MGLRTFLGLKRPRLDAEQKPLGGIGPLDLSAVIAAHRSGHPDFFFVQIGAHTGGKGDPLFESIKRLNLRGLLVKPKSMQFAKLREAYSDQPQLIFEQAALARSSGSVPLYKIRQDFWERHGFPKGLATEISSLDREHIRKHVAYFGNRRLAERIDEYLTQETVPAFTLNDLLSKHSIGRVDLLQIDTEGFDYEVIKMIDWAGPRPAMLHFEAVHLGKEDRIAVWDLLRRLGYVLYATNAYNTLAVSTT